jgi:8-oxo-dGTP pyrophosphatase MutT (NUDIX family)
MNLQLFHSLFTRAAGTQLTAPGAGSGERGDHDLNPGAPMHNSYRPAAVLVPIVDRPEGLTVLLTKRSDDLPVHAGQVSFPGGRVDDFDAGPVETALRESEEEIGLNRRHVEVIGRLDTYKTGTGFEITPIVGLLRPPFELVAEPGEVAEIFEVPMTFICDRNNHHRRSGEWRAQTRHFYVLPFDDYHIWGATAGMLVNLADVIEDTQNSLAAD